MNYRRHLISLIIMLCLAAEAFTQQTEVVQAKPVEAWDNSPISWRSPGADTINYYKAQPRYQYVEQNTSLNWWQQFIQRLLSLLLQNKGTLTALGWLLLLMITAAIAYIIIRLTGIQVKGLFVFSRAARVTQLAFNMNQAHINSQELDQLLKVCISNNAYREATRVLFLQILSELNQYKLIQWTTYKTNRAYYNEIQDKDLQKHFLYLMRQYEYIWFGLFNTNIKTFKQLQTDFNQFSKLLKKRPVTQS